MLLVRGGGGTKVGTADDTALTVQGNASGIAIPVSLSAGGVTAAVAEVIPQGATAIDAATTTVNSVTYVDVLAAPGAALRSYITCLIISNSGGALSTVTISLDGGTTGNIVFTAAASGGGLVLTLPKALRCGVNTKVQAKQAVAAAGLTVTLCGYSAA